MSSILPIGVEDLLSGQTVEIARLEFKASWNKDNTGPQILQTLCAFANDLHNLNGGYIVIAVAEKAGVAQRPVRGRIQPTYRSGFFSGGPGRQKNTCALGPAQRSTIPSGTGCAQWKARILGTHRCGNHQGLRHAPR